MFGGRTAKPGRPARSDPPPSQTAGRSAGSLLAARLIGAAGGWIGTVVIVRELTRGEFGGYSFIFGLLGVVGLIVDLQISRIVLREVLEAGDDAGRIVGSYTLMRTVIGAIAYGAAVLFVIIGNYDHEVVVGTLVGGLGFLFIAPNNGLAVWFHARLWMRPGATATVLATIVQLSLVLAFAFSGRSSIVAFAAAVTTGELTILAWRIWCTHTHGLHLQFAVDVKRWWHWLRESIPLAIGFGLVSLYYKLDILLLSQLDSLDAVGQYTIGYKFADLVGFVPYAITTPVMTLMIAAWPHAARRLWVHFRQAFVILFVIAVAVAVGFTLVSAPLIDLLYGHRYAGSVNAARLLVVGSTLQFFSYLCFVTLASIGRDRAYALAGFLGLVVNSVLNVGLIPPFSFDGSAVATVITEIVVFGVLLYALHKSYDIVTIPVSVMLRTVVAGAGMAAVYLALDLVVPWPAAGAVAGLVFLALLHVLAVDGPGGLRALVLGARFDVEIEEPVDEPRGAAAPEHDARTEGDVPTEAELAARDPYPPIRWYADMHGL